jgi:hypothetical protein
VVATTPWHAFGPTTRGFVGAKVVHGAKITDPFPMPASNIPDEVRRFLVAVIPSVPHLEALLLLHSEPGTGWAAAALARRLYIDETAAARVLGDLSHHGLLHKERDGYRFAPADADLAGVTAQLARVYARHVVEVAELIHSSSDRKAQRFADAFRLRKEP